MYLAVILDAILDFSARHDLCIQPAFSETTDPDEHLVLNDRSSYG